MATSWRSWSTGVHTHARDKHLNEDTGLRLQHRTGQRSFAHGTDAGSEPACKSITQVSGHHPLLWNGKQDTLQPPFHVLRERGDLWRVPGHLRRVDSFNQGRARVVYRHQNVAREENAHVWID